MEVNIIYLKNLSIFLFLMICTIRAQAQDKIELKVNLLPLWASAPVELSGEYLLNDKLGIEVGVGYTKDETGRYILDSLSGDFISVPISKYTQINFYAEAKYYIMKNVMGHRLFGGAMLYHQRYTEYKRYDIPNAKTPGGSSAIGAELGYKWLLIKKIPIELSFRLLVGTEPLGENDRTSFLDGTMNGKIGFRF